MNININIKYNFFKRRKKQILIINPVLLLNIIFSNQMTKTWCVGGRHKSELNNIIEYETVNPRIKKLVKIIKGTCSICGRNKSQNFTK